MNGRRRTGRLLVLGVAFATAVLWRPVGFHLRAAGLLVRMGDPDANGVVAGLGRHPVDERLDEIAGSKARLYWPRGLDHPAALVLAHGVHFKGIDEPRLQRFARTLAASGVEVLTPELAELCDYRIDAASVEALGRVTQAFSERVGAKVGLAGISFAGGLSLVAASDPRYARAVSFVLTIGAHDDLGRVLRFFATGEATRPDGSVLRVQPYDYGAVVVEYAHAADFFPAADVDAARDTLGLVLHEDFAAARARSLALSPGSQAALARIFSHDAAALAPELLGEVARLAPDLEAVSPSAHVARLAVPTFVLHASGDQVVPPTEAAWLAHDVPRAWLRDVLVSDAMQHADLGRGASALDQLRLVHFMADVLDAAER